MAYVNPGAGNVQVIGGAGMALQVAFSKNPARFTHLNALKRIPSAKIIGPYAEYDADDVARIETADEASNWRDGTNRPAHSNIRHEIRTFNCERWADTAAVGTLAIQQSEIDTVVAQSTGITTRLMLRKARDFEKLATDPANLTHAEPSGTTDIGGKLDAATSANPYIRRAFHYAVNAIVLAGRGAVALSDIHAIMGAKTAKKLAGTSELKDWLFNHNQSIAAFQQSDIFQAYGLPPRLYGVKIHIANESFVTSKQGAASVTSRFMFQDLGTVSGSAVKDPIVFYVRTGGDRPGALQDFHEPLNAGDLNTAPVNPQDISTFAEVYEQDIMVETMADQWNRIQNIGVSANFDHIVTSRRTGLLLRDVLTT